MASTSGLISFSKSAQMADRLADLAALQLKTAISERGSALLALSGGSTPKALYEALSLRDLPWELVTVFLVDDRWVAPGQAGSNETFLQEHFLKNRAANANYISLYADHATPADALDDVTARFETVEWPIDFAVLGMGEDGHTASWFPHAEGLETALTSTAPFAAVTATQSKVTGAFLMRITLTLDALAKTRTLALLISGDAKRAVFETAASGGPADTMPIRAILTQRPDMWACWCP